jgi:NAD(P)-dependent dehydrogenase (short-subunit alcohol dehydrogenase family)
MRLQGKVAFITGGGSGLGRESALLFASEGAKVAVFDLSADRAAGTEKLVRDQGGEIVAVQGDVRVEEDLARAVAETVEAFGTIDIVFANAGVVSKGGVPGVLGGSPIDITEYPLEDWNVVLGTNLTGVFLTVKHTVPVLRRGGGGSIVCTSSAASFVAYPNIPGYTASKAGVNGLVRNLAFDLGRDGIRVNAIAPTHGMSPNFLLPPDAEVVGKSYEENAGNWDPSVSPIPLKLSRPPSLKDNARAALFLASDDAAYISGVTLPATDGGTLSRVAMTFEGDAARDHSSWKKD